MHEKNFLLITLSLIVMLGAPGVYSMIQEPVVAGSKVANSNRAPASEGERASVIVDQSAQKKFVKTKSVTLDFNCKKKSTVENIQEIDGNLLRLRGNSCFNEKWKNVSIINKTNGFTAAVIFVNQGFTTDFMDMADGINQVSVTGINEKGQAVEHVLTINKRSPASL